MPKRWARAAALSALLLTDAVAAQLTLLAQPQPEQVVVWVTADDAMTGREARPEDPAWLNALRHLSQIVPAAVVGAVVECHTGEAVTRVLTDRRGKATCARTAGELRVRFQGWEAALPDFGLHQATHVTVSDLDDTLLKTGVKQGGIWRALRQNALTRPVFGEMPAFLRGRASLGPVVYLSNSPEGLTRELTALLARRGFPAGPLLLRDFTRESGPQHKSGALRALAEAAPAQFTLLGDDGEQDPELYAAFAHAYPDRVEQILIRDVVGGTRRAEVEKLLAGLNWAWLPPEF